MSATEMNLIEIFASVQGEGAYVGRSTLFIRFAECNLRCLWCDSPETWFPSQHCRVEVEPGTGRFRTLTNPIGLSTVERLIDDYRLRNGSLVSLTGGEPLLQPDAVSALAHRLRSRGLRVYLETHGLAVDALARVVEDVDIVAMDWKLASAVRRASDAPRGPVAPFHDWHERFLRLARAHCEVSVKVVVTPETREEELDEVCRRMAACAPEVPLVLQPVTPAGGVGEAPAPQVLLAWLRHCEQQLADVRVIPQTHRMIGMR